MYMYIYADKFFLPTLASKKTTKSRTNHYSLENQLYIYREGSK